MQTKAGKVRFPINSPLGTSNGGRRVGVLGAVLARGLFIVCSHTRTRKLIFLVFGVGAHNEPEEKSVCETKRKNPRQRRGEARRGKNISHSPFAVEVRWWQEAKR